MKIKLGKLCNIVKGKTGIQKAKPGQYPLVVTAEDRLTSNEYQFNQEAVCIPMVSSTGHGHASLNRIHYQEGKFALGNILCAVTSKDENILSTKFLYYYLSTYKDEILVPLMKGSANVSLSLTSLNNLEITIPPITKQHEIIKKIDLQREEIDKVKIKFSRVLEDIELLVSKKMNDIISDIDEIAIDDLFIVKKGTLQSTKTIPGEYAFVTAAEEWKTSSVFEHDGEALVFAMGASGSLGRTHYVNEKFIASDLCYVIFPKRDIDLNFYNYLFGHLRDQIVKDTATGSAKLAINQRNFKSYRLPYINKSISDKWTVFFKQVFEIRDSIEKQSLMIDEINKSFELNIFEK